MTICYICNAPLRFKPGVGWVHPGGGVYVQRCRSCGTHSDRGSRATCPNCGLVTDWIDDHCVQPVAKMNESEK